MGSITEQFAHAFRNFASDGVPSSGVNEPEKAEIRAIGPVIEAALGTIGLGSVNVVKTTRALLDADLAHGADSTAIVYADSTDANNDLYVKVGASGTGSWTNTGALHLIIGGLAQPYVDEAQAAADSIEDIRESLMSWTRPAYAVLADTYFDRTTGVQTSLPGTYHAIKVAVPNGVTRARASASVNGGAIALALFLDASDDVISFVHGGTNGVTDVYINEEFDIPAGTESIAITGLQSASISLDYLTLIDDIAIQVSDLATSQLTWVDQVLDLDPGYYDRDDGSYNAFPGYQSAKIAIVPGSLLRPTGFISGGPAAALIYFDASDDVLGYEVGGTNGVTTRYGSAVFTAPADATSVAITGYNSTPRLEVAESQSDLGRQFSDLRSAANPKGGLTGVWFGTSIPADTAPVGSYVDRIATALEMTITNEAVGASMARNGAALLKNGATDPYGWTGLQYYNVAYALAGSLAEKNELIANFASKWSSLLLNAPVSLSADEQAFILDCSYENKLVARHLGANRKNVYIFDHGHNDGLAFTAYPSGPTYAAWSSEMVARPGIDSPYAGLARNDRGTFLGAIAFLIDLILSDNPRARIVFVGHYENARKTNISLAQAVLAEQWDFPLLRTWERLGWSQQVIQSGPDTGKTITQVWLTDDLHPSSDVTGRACDRIAEVLAPMLRDA